MLRTAVGGALGVETSPVLYSDRSAEAGEVGEISCLTLTAYSAEERVGEVWEEAAVDVEAEGWREALAERVGSRSGLRCFLFM